ncbi:MAG TPA: efflux RND transporter periplasmic adaptor subunit [Rhizomicrobium sp.]|nr:efflux RND transporter periplasmic adaptor subunit [Rhizomicrobium sp.]
MKPKNTLLAVVTTFLFASAAQADPSALVRLAPARVAQLAPQISAYGTVSADANFVTTVFMPREGVVAAILARPGQTVRAGDPLVTIRTAPAAAATYEQAVSTADFAAKDYDHTKQLFAEQLATRSQLAAAAKADADARAQLSAQQKIGANHAEETLTAPVAGIVATMVPARGDPVQPGADVASIATSGQVVLNLGVEPRDAIALRPGNSVLLPAQQGLPQMRARVGSVGAMVDPASHLVNVLVPLPADARIFIGTALQAKVDLAPVSGVVVASSALMTDGDASYLFVAQGGKAKRRTVKVAFETDTAALIASGLKANENVVVQGVVGLADGSAIRTSE